MLLKNGLVFIDGKYEHTDVLIEDDKIKRLEKIEGDGIDVSNKKIIPGLTDIHTHGALGADTCDRDINSIKKIAKYNLENGTMQFCPTTMTLSEEELVEIFKVVGEYDDEFAKVVGIHMEGPFISAEKIGAQNPKFIAEPNYEMAQKLDEVSGGKLKIISIAPELTGIYEFNKKVAGKYILSVAHTNATYEEALFAFNNGFSHLTHMFNAMPGIHHRKPGPIIAAYEAGATVELITDGIHIHDSVIRFSFDAFGKDRIILVSDSNEATGLKDGDYMLGGQPITKKGRRAVLKGTNTIAGSSSNLMDCLKHAIKAGVNEECAVAAATINPAKKLGIINEIGAIKTGNIANLLVVDDNYNIEKIILRGEEYEKN
ncbi:MAG: N-acetylglucosamine-6-phosphate deacetylase [Ezakiella sp.]|nr:N-acetylglucosamine-6-phosphate deacetylase [Ezakiella sp.]MDD7471700.1 N-acetylglucosamine-6-phosphate deacetylase [Bacillota bacterium]MDY3922970.1 N-acetylglucosamine-6-phosphate deacetylase [Ezakiella sp.]